MPKKEDIWQFTIKRVINTDKETENSIEETKFSRLIFVVVYAIIGVGTIGAITINIIFNL